MQPTSIHSITSFERHGPSGRERLLSLVLLGLLAVIALVIFRTQSRFDPDYWRVQSDTILRQAVSGPTPDRQETLDRSAQVVGLAPMSPPEHFGPETLSDKINGKAELYLPSGFRHLESRRLAATADPGLWIERFVYDMGSDANAFAVFSQQRRAGSEPMALAPHAYRSANGIFFVQGPFYVELIGSDTSAAVMDHMDALARAFVAHHPVAAAVADESALLPETHRVADSLTLTAANAFGFEGLDRIYAARYQWNGRTAMAFVSRRDSSAAAARLADDYVAFLKDFGGRPLVPPDDAAHVRIIEMFDLVQIVFSHGDLLAGVHEAEDLADGLALADALYRRIRDGAP